MKTKFFALITVIGFASVCIVQAQSPTPGESPAQAPSKHRTHKKAQTTSSSEAGASPAAAASPAASPAGKRGRKKAEAATGANTAASPAPAASPAASPKARRARTKGAATAAASPVATPTPQFKLGDLFKPRGSAAASPAPTAAPARGRSAEVASNPPAPGGGHGFVWVNTETHVYHREGSRFYGTTKKGKYMTESQAVQEGNRAAAKGM